MTHKIFKIEKLTHQDFENGTAIVMINNAVQAITFGSKVFQAKDNEIVQQVYQNPNYIFQIMDLIAKDEQLLEACFDVLDRRLKGLKIPSLKEIQFVDSLNDTLELLELPPFRPDIFNHEKVKFGDEEPQKI